ncbi:hypothetical protein C3R44_22355, partial [Mycobacterium tuberculosis]|uniref:hypothetical protein n=1 Tax=Mycobacterium tuberculosis TaxID=1773 RepID=UPI000E39882D
FAAAGRCPRGSFLASLGGAPFAVASPVARLRRSLAGVAPAPPASPAVVLAAAAPAPPSGAALPWPASRAAGPARPGRTAG